jgi:glucose-6-phosphate 1-dehydrogenase
MPSTTVAYGFFPIRRTWTLRSATKLVHSANERIRVDDLEHGVAMLRSVARPLARRQSELADALVVFGITGDLARTKTLPALYDLTEQGVPQVSPPRGAGAARFRTTRCRSTPRAAIELPRARARPSGSSTPSSSASRTSAVRGRRSSTHIKTALQGGEAPVFYLAIPPASFLDAAEELADGGLLADARLVVEKPVRTDSSRARARTAV